MWGGRNKIQQSDSDMRRWSLLRWSPTRTGRTKRTSGLRGAGANQSTSRLATLRAKMRMKNPYVFLQYAPAPAPAAAPEGRAAHPPLLTPAATSEGRAASPAPLSTADVSGGRATPTTAASVNEGSGPAEFGDSGVSSRSSVGRGS